MLLVGDDLEQIRIIVAWTNTSVARAKKLTSLRGDSDTDVWQWLWSNATYFREDLLTKCALSEYAFDNKMRPLIEKPCAVSRRHGQFLCTALSA